MTKKEANDTRMSELCNDYENSLKERDANQNKIDSNQARVVELEEKVLVSFLCVRG